MRETRFRGKCNKEWCYGYYVNNHGGFLQHVILPVGVFADELKDIGRIEFDEYCIVDPDTVGQGVKIDGKWYFEGDIIRYTFGGNLYGIVRFGRYNADTKDHVGFSVDWVSSNAKYYRGDLGYWHNKKRAEVVGNIWDNPELVGWYNNES